MKLPLSQRLLACAGFVEPGDRVADVGCDHGYLGIHLLREGVADAVLASDVHQAPLESALANAVKYGVREKMRFFLADGLRGLPPEYDVVICAGMGADTIISILEAAPWLRESPVRLVLQCQSRRPQLRRYLSSSGWTIRAETLARDGKFLYPVMEVVWGPAEALTDAQCWVSPALLECGSPLLPEFLARLAASLERTVAGLAGSPGEKYETYRAILAQVRQWEGDHGNGC